MSACCVTKYIIPDCFLNPTHVPDTDDEDSEEKRSELSPDREDETPGAVLPRPPGPPGRGPPGRGPPGRGPPGRGPPGPRAPRRQGAQDAKVPEEMHCYPHTQKFTVCVVVNKSTIVVSIFWCVFYRKKQLHVCVLHCVHPSFWNGSRTCILIVCDT